MIFFFSYVYGTKNNGNDGAQPEEYTKRCGPQIDACKHDGVVFVCFQGKRHAMNLNVVPTPAVEERAREGIRDADASRMVFIFIFIFVFIL